MCSILVRKLNLSLLILSIVSTFAHETKSQAEVEGEIDSETYNNLIVNADFGMGVDVLFLFVDLGYQMGISPVYSGGDAAKANSFYGNLGIRLGF